MGASSRGTPRTTTGRLDSPSLFQGEVKGDITVISFKLGNAGIVASGWGVKRFVKLIGTMVIQSLDLLAGMGMKSALMEKPLIPASI